MNKEKESTWLCQRHQEFDVGFMCCLVTKNSTAGESLTLNSSFSVNAGKSLTFEQLSTRRSNLSTLFLSNCWTSLLSDAGSILIFRMFLREGPATVFTCLDFGLDFILLGKNEYLQNFYGNKQISGKVNSRLARDCGKMDK